MEVLVERKHGYVNDYLNHTSNFIVSRENIERRYMAKSTEVSYPMWKVILWRFVRGGVSGAVTSLLLVQVVLQPDLSNLKLYGYALLSAALTGFISAGGLALREVLSDGDKESNVQKLPI